MVFYVQLRYDFPSALDRQNHRSGPPISIPHYTSISGVFNGALVARNALNGFLHTKEKLYSGTVFINNLVSAVK